VTPPFFLYIMGEGEKVKSVVSIITTAAVCLCITVQGESSFKLSSYYYLYGIGYN
jgi:hypothetical protein